MKKKFIILSIFLISFTSCNQVKKSLSKELGITEEFELKETDYVILSNEAKGYWMFENSKPAELSLAEINEIEEIIIVAIKENNKHQKKVLKEHNDKYSKYNKREKTGFELKREGYRRQYLAVLNEAGEKEIWINFFCDNFGAERWETEIVDVNDGGNCYFQLTVNLPKKNYYDLSVNGYA